MVGPPKRRARSRASAKAAGSKFARIVADYFHKHVSEWIDKAPLWGAHDRGDILNLRTKAGDRVVVECKEYRGEYKVGTWLKEAEIERMNDNALVGLVVAKRRGHGDPGDQVVFMTMRDLVALITDERPE